MTKKKVVQPLEHDPSKFSTNRELLENFGLILTDNRSFRPVGSMTLILSGMLHYSLRVILTYHELELLTVMKVLHLTLIYLLVAVCGTVVLRQSKRFLVLHSIIRNGFYKYPQGLTDEQLMIRSRANEKVLKITKYGLRFFVIATLGSTLKEPLPYDFQVWTRQYNGWFPFVVDSWSKYVVSQIYHLMAALSAALLGGSVCIVFIAIAEHLLAQLEILSISLKNAIHDVPDPGDSRANYLAYLKIKSCVKHHHVILRFFIEFQKYYSIPVLSMLAGTTVAMCTIAFVVTDPNSTFGVSAAFLSLMAPEIAFCLCYCTYGQKITDMGFNVRDTVCNAPWYCHSKKVQLALLMILIKTRTPLTLTAAGLKDCSIKSIGEVRL
uniref:Odorant receptor n=1 Tax=Cyrtorhinus lividipennis TaxID=1032904 RepID=A0A346TI12_9HEMI|nr:odorant receptor 4 [Cyrtorhinus lividipennis]